MTDSRKILAGLYILTALILGAIIYSGLVTNEDWGQYFRKEYYNKLGPIAICVEMLVAGIHLFSKHKSANFTLALFAFTALLDPIFNAIGLFQTNVPVYATIIFIILALPALWIAFSNTFSLGRISWPKAALSFVFGVLIELFFNYW